MTTRYVIAALLLVAGCESGAPMQDVPTTFDGKILFRALGEGSAFEVELCASPIASPVLPTLGDGHCDVHPPGEGDGFANGIFVTPPPADLDLGDTIVATDGAVTLSGTTQSDGTFQYEAGLATSGTRFDSTWTLASSGASDGLAAGTLVTVHTPAAVTSDSFQPIDTTSGNVTIPCTGGAGAATFHIQIEGTKADVDCYPPTSATSFTLPASVLGSIDASITPLVWAETVSYVAIGERHVLVRVTADNLD